MPRNIDPFGEFESADNLPDKISAEEMNAMISRGVRTAIHSKKQKDAYHAFMYNIEADTDIPPELWQKRLELTSDYVTAHEKIFPMSTGQKPFGADQQTAIRRFQRIVQSRGKLVQAEPRGFAKTSRAINQLLLAILEGKVRFALVVSSAIDKSEDIMDQLKTELLSNDQIKEYYPTIAECFARTEGKPYVASRLMINGEPTGMAWTNDQIIFPAVPGEPSSGAILLVRTKDNLRGISKRIRYGENAGRVVRPDFILLDDVQTDKDAVSPTVCKKIIQTIKRSALFGGSHSKKIRAIMTITPSRRGDVASHFMLHEPSWEVAQYSMLKKFPKNMDLWDEFAAILLNFDKHKEGDREKAQRRAAEFVRTNYDTLHEGAEAAWEWAYEWDTDDPIELSAVHHAMTFFYEEGEEAFNYECQCKIEEPEDSDEILKATPEIILSRKSHLSRRKIPADCKHIVTHVDCNQEVLTYMTVTSDTTLRPYIIDYGTFPPQPGDTWKKKDLMNPLYRYYSGLPREDVATQLYQAVIDLSTALGNTKYIREDGAELMHRYIGFDINWQLDTVLRAIRECNHRSFVIGTQGIFYGVKDRPMMEQTGSDREMHFHCFTAPSADRVIPVLKMDTNNLKTLAHRGFLTNPGTIGSIKIFPSETSGGHNLFTEHLIAENPEQKINIKDNRVIVEWAKIVHNHDNEYLDNLVGCLALLFKCGCTLRNTKEIKRVNMASYMKQN
jgi:hypothetical protein